MSFTINEIIEATHATVILANEDEDNLTVSTDTRTIGRDMLYLPLKGENFNGFDFIQNALDAGAAGYFTENPNDVNLDADIILLVKNTKTAYLELAEYYRKKVNPITVLITGSSGKTTVKEMMASVFEVKYKTHKTKLNHNNEIGLCQTLLSMPEDTKALIAEGGMRGLGEIELISKYTKPDRAVITNVGTAHIGRLGSVENIAKAKCEIVKFLNDRGVLIAPDNDLIKQFNTFKGKNIYIDFNNISIEKTEENGSEFVYKDHRYFISQEGEHNVQNAALVIETALSAGMTEDEIAEGLKNFKSIDKRWETEKIGSFEIINDCYNSNPDSVKAAIKTFLNGKNGKKIVVLGDMGELGDDAVKYHIETGKYLEQFDFDCLLTFGELSENMNPQNKLVKHFDDKQKLAEYIVQNYRDGAKILFKASRSMKFEEIIEEMKKYADIVK
ncbi:MAG: UDP-N-acetylmuramoyl-tripeptide--D-alanyl-D-alanine ligase [Candidatus Gastranaerophilales bacterium]|nr:UDP-N-acetylmuramoyl-tripeptide--D-alanyl-D-alanine ligase [Candidatus Gastranaerophilales bacterium]